MSTFKIVKPKARDIEKIAELYTKVAEIEDGLARTKNEITLEYIRHNFEQSQLTGVSLIAVENDVVVGELHAYFPFIQEPHANWTRGFFCISFPDLNDLCQSYVITTISINFYRAKLHLVQPELINIRGFPYEKKNVVLP